MTNFYHDFITFETPSVGCKIIKAKTKNKFIYLGYTFFGEFDERFMSDLSYQNLSYLSDTVNW